MLEYQGSHHHLQQTCRVHQEHLHDKARPHDNTSQGSEGERQTRGHLAAQIPCCFASPLLNFSIRKDSEKVDSSDSSHVIGYLSCHSVLRPFDISHVIRYLSCHSALSCHSISLMSFDISLHMSHVIRYLSYHWICLMSFSGATTLVPHRGV